jgi:hypothetical protein
MRILHVNKFLYRRGGAGEIPVRRMIGRSEAELADLADAMARRIPRSEVVADVGYSGGGALPGTGLATRVVAFEVRDVDADPADRAAYTDKVPVVLLDGVEHAYWQIDEKALRRALR